MATYPSPFQNMKKSIGVLAGSLFWLLLLAEFPMFTIMSTLAVGAVWVFLSNY